MTGRVGFRRIDACSVVDPSHFGIEVDQFLKAGFRRYEDVLQVAVLAGSFQLRSGLALAATGTSRRQATRAVVDRRFTQAASCSVNNGVVLPDAGSTFSNANSV